MAIPNVIPFEEDTENLISELEKKLGRMGQYLENSRNNPTFQNVAIYTNSIGKLWYGDAEKDKIYSALELTKFLTNEVVYLISADDNDATHSFMLI